MKLFWPPNRNREGSDSQNQLFLGPPRPLCQLPDFFSEAPIYLAFLLSLNQW
jgi:hypothetical protein